MHASQIVEILLSSGNEEMTDVNNEEVFPSWKVVSGELMSYAVLSFSLLGEYFFLRARYPS